ncbi:NAD(P)/FAD-dependent oxidoreductase [Modicisalibacter coralii]|uniref:NAD(P)/FAD-dependent oxidoreductase n=1 Tax=Modicisalibacter coralii TaxID=2304602 RepID=UPI00100A68DD|nr:FAD-dependent oxidoreductase [Halomonas coralii]
MDLKSGYPFWAIKNGLFQAFPRLDSHETCDVAVIGGGITGALIAHELAQHGHDVTVLERRDVGWGSSAASTALLQYEIDTHLTELAERVGEASAVDAYRACADAILALDALANRVGDVDFARQQSLYFASDADDVDSLRREWAYRRQHGFDADWLEPDTLREHFGVEAPGAILTPLAARIDPYRMAHRLFARLLDAGGRVYDRTEITAVRPQADRVVLTTQGGADVTCRHLIVAAGYEAQSWLDQSVAVNRSSYAFITDPIEPARLGALNSTLIWESARPYLYLRTTGDGRLMVGGEDDDIDIPARRDQRVHAKAETLVAKVEALFPNLSLNPIFSWGGTFAETDDGLPFFGPHPTYGPRVHFAMAYGGNGISYSMVGADLLRARIEGRGHPLAELFSFRRLSG